MTFKEIAAQIKARKANQGEFVSDNLAKRLACLEITEGFRTIGEARECVETLRETGNIFCTAWGYNVDADCLEEAVEMFFPSGKVSGNATLSMKGLFGG